ncbi:MAG: UbiA family prenyltransferase [Candidatus Aenigmarchaeota archaeon]|nr:UbiA family prenyltransferase [Candidatus Aenigmarchaeota archaeon]
MNTCAYWRILRVSNGFLALFAVVVGAVVSGAGMDSFVLIVYLALSVFLISGAGIILNDYYDYENDKINAPNRPLPSGQISKRSALIYAAVLFAAGIALAGFVNIYVLGLAVLNTVLEFLYAWKLKPIALLGNTVDSWFAASSFLYGALITLDFEIVWLLIAMSFFANLGREIYGDIEDVAGDKKAGAKTLPILIGGRKATLAAQAAIIIAIILSVLPYTQGYFGLRYLAPILVANGLFIQSLFQDAHTNQKTTKRAMLVALVAFLIGVV